MNKELFVRASQYYHSGNPLQPYCEEYEQSMALLTKAVQENVDPAKAYGLRWHIHFLRGNYGLALRDLDHAILLNGNSANTFYNRGYLNRHMKRYGAALADFKQAMSLAKIHGDNDLVDAAEHHVYELKKRQMSKH